MENKIEEKEQVLEEFLTYMLDWCKDSGRMVEGVNLAEDGIRPFITVSDLELQALLDQFLEEKRDGD